MPDTDAPEPVESPLERLRRLARESKAARVAAGTPPADAPADVTPAEVTPAEVTPVERPAHEVPADEVAVADQTASQRVEMPAPFPTPPPFELPQQDISASTRERPPFAARPVAQQAPDLTAAETTTDPAAGLIEPDLADAELAGRDDDLGDAEVHTAEGGASETGTAEDGAARDGAVSDGTAEDDASDVGTAAADALGDLKLTGERQDGDTAGSDGALAGFAAEDTQVADADLASSQDRNPGSSTAKATEPTAGGSDDRSTATDSGATPAGSLSGVPAQRSGFLPFAVGILAVLVILAGVGFGFAHHYQSDHKAPLDAQDAARAAAGHAVTDLNTLDYRNVADWLTRVKADSTGGLQADFANKSTEVQQAVSAAKSVTTATVAASAYCGGNCTTAQVAGDTAAALVYCRSNVVTAARPAGDILFQRFTVKLAKVNGKWLATNIDIVGDTAAAS